MGAINAFVFWRTRAHRLPLPRFSQILTTELVFLSVCTAIVIIKAFHPEIYQIERFMDFGFIETLRNSTGLPLTDLWLAGETLNYYYMSHFIGFVILTLAGIPSVPGFLFSSGVSRVPCLRLSPGLLLMSLYISQAEGSVVSYDKISSCRRQCFRRSFFRKLVHDSWIVQRIGFLFGVGQMPDFFTRSRPAIVGTITEMPIFSFLVADIHAHVWGMLTALGAFHCVFNVARYNGEIKCDKSLPLGRWHSRSVCPTW